MRGGDFGCHIKVLRRSLLSSSSGIHDLRLKFGAEENLDDEELADRLYNDDRFVLLSHTCEEDPIFNYANVAGQRLFKMSFAEFVKVPSRMSAEPLLREARQLLLDKVSRDGYTDDYEGVRVASDGTRFLIRNALVWDLFDDDGARCGAAAFFDGSVVEYLGGGPT